MKIYPLNNVSLYNPKPLNKPAKDNQPGIEQKHSAEYRFYGYNDYLLNFTARVDKGLDRFYEANKDRMPLTVKEYIETLDDKSKLTPLEAQQEAFKELGDAETIDDIKSAYPKEELFKDLVNPLDTRATRGILNSARENDELLKLSDQDILKNKSNLTVYLVKKIFLENKTIDEINKDLDCDLDEDFKADFKFDNPDSPYIYKATINALGIKTPTQEYRQSLRYTKDGYSDMIGDKISAAQKAFWDSLPLDERIPRAKKSVEKFEAWWNSLSENQKLDMIADQVTTLDMLKSFKKHQGKRHVSTVPESDTENNTEKPSKHVKVGSNKLSQDELFKLWAANNLKVYQENLTEAEKDALHIKRMRNLAARWKEMTPEEKTDYISKMKSGSEPLRYTMIDAWNHSTEIIAELSRHLKENQIYKPADLLYSTQEFSSFQSKVMTEFWEKHPEYSTLLGENIIKSQKKIEKAISNGTFEELKKEIMRDKNRRIKEMKTLKVQLQNTVQEADSVPEYIKEFKNAYYKQLSAQLKNLPQDYINDYFKIIETGFSKEQIEAWTRNLRGEPLTEEDYIRLEEISITEPAGGARINRILEAALADTVYACTKNPKVYELSHSDLKVILTQIDRGEPVAKIQSQKLHEYFETPILKKKVDKNRISFLYHQYSAALDDEELEEIVQGFFRTQGENYEDLTDYLKTYGKSINIIFSDKSAYPKDVKDAMLKKFIKNMPENLEENVICVLNLRGSIHEGESPFEVESKINHLKYMLGKRFDFVPSVYMDKYLKEFGTLMRFDFRNSPQNRAVYELACKKRTDTKSNSKLSIMPKFHISTSNKLRTLAMEEALADILYEATGNIDVYKLQFEELCDNIELFRLVDKFPSETRHYPSALNGTIDLTAQKRPNISKLKSKYLEYQAEIADWVNTNVKNGNGTMEDLMCILNPDENMPEKDNAVIERIKLYNLNLS